MIDWTSTECPTCERNDFATRRSMKVHHKRTHGESIAGELIECDNCGEEFRRAPSKIERDEHNLCSKDCHHEWTADNVHKWANPTVENLSPNSKNQVVKQCTYCGIEFERPASALANTELPFCGFECYGKWRSENKTGENHPRWNGVGEVYYGENWQRQRNLVREIYDYTCVRCGTSKSDLGRCPDVHHITPLKIFKDRYEAPEWWIKGNDTDNLILLCPQCHKQWEGIPVKPEVAINAD